MNKVVMLAILGSLSVAAGCASTGAPKAGAAAAAPAAAPAAASAASGGAGACAGNWKVEIETPMGPQTSPFKLAQSGDQVTGKAADPMSGSENDVTGTCKGGAITLVQKVQSPMGEMQLDFAGTVSGSSMSGTVKFGSFGDGKFSGTKQ